MLTSVLEQNVLIKSGPPTGNWWVVLSDFGLSKRVESIATGTSGLLGTPGFMAPELYGFHGEQAELVYHSSDIWCVGEMAFQMMIGRPAFATLAVLFEYTRGESEFPARALTDFSPPVDQRAVDFVKLLMLATPSRRPSATSALSHPWIAEIHVSPMNSTSDTSAPAGLDESSVVSLGPSKKATEVNVGPGPPISKLSQHVVGEYEISELLLSRAGGGVAMQAFRVGPGTARTEITGNRTVVFSPDSKTLAVAVGTIVEIWDAQEVSIKNHVGYRRPGITGGDLDSPSCVSWVTFSPDSRWVALAPAEGRVPVVFVWNTLTGDLVFRFQGHQEPITSIAFDPEGKRLVSVSRDNTLRLWHLNSPSSKTPKSDVQKLKAPTTWAGFYTDSQMPSGKDLGQTGRQSTLVLAPTKGKVQVWTRSNMAAFRPFFSPLEELEVSSLHGPSQIPGSAHGERITSMALSPEGSWIALGLQVIDGIQPTRNFVRLWHLDDTDSSNTPSMQLSKFKSSSAVPLRPGHDHPIHSIVVFGKEGPETMFVASASRDMIKIWRVDGFWVVLVSCIGAFDPGPIHSMAMSPDSKIIAFTTSSNALQLWDIKKITKLSDILLHFDMACFWAFSPNRRYAASVNTTGRMGTSIMVWDVEKASPWMLIPVCGVEYQEQLLSLSFSSNSAQIGCVSNRFVIRIWDVGSGAQLERIEVMPLKRGQTVEAYRAILTPNLRLYAAAYSASGTAHSIRIHALGMHLTYANAKTWTLPRDSSLGKPLAIAFSHDGHTLAELSQGGHITVWMIGSFSVQQITTIGSVQTGIRLPDYSPGYAGVSTLGYFGIAFSPDGSNLALFSSQHVIAEIWDLQDGKPIFKKGDMVTLAKNDIGRYTASLASNPPDWISPDWTRCVTGGLPGPLLWDIASGKELGPLLIYSKSEGYCTIQDVCFSPDSRLVAVVSYDEGKLSIWDAQAGRLKKDSIDIGKKCSRGVFFWPDSKRVVTRCGHDIEIWDVETGTSTKIAGHSRKPGIS